MPIAEMLRCFFSAANFNGGLNSQHSYWYHGMAVGGAAKLILKDTLIGESVHSACLSHFVQTALTIPKRQLWKPPITYSTMKVFTWRSGLHITRGVYHHMAL